MFNYYDMFFSIMKYFLFGFLFFVISGSFVYTQTTSTTSGSTTTLRSTQFDTSGFPLWAKDLRRAEIVAFGSFPLMVFFATFAIDTYRFSTNSWDRRYAPWPLTAAGSVDRTEDEQIVMLTVAAAGSMVIALADFFIVHYKRQKQREYINSLPGTPIIIRKPWHEEKLEANSSINENPGAETRSGSEVP
jgi:hypothetical protein